MIDITLDDGTILDIETDDPAQANAAAWNFLTHRAHAQSATSPYPPEFLPSQQPGPALAFAAPSNDAPAVNAIGTTHTVAIDGGEDDAPLWQRAVKQSRLSDEQRAMLRHELGPDAQSLSDEQMYALLARHADEKSGPGQTILVRTRRTLGDDGWRAFAAAKLRSIGRNDPKADFDPAGFRAGWGGLSDNFKVQLAPEHRKAIDALDAAGRATRTDGAPAPDPLAILQHQMGGNLVARWIAWPTAAPALARWTREVELASRLPPERGASMHALANVALANAVAHVSGDDPAAIRARLDAGLPAEAIAAAEDPDERAAERRRRDVGRPSDGSMPTLFAERGADNHTPMSSRTHEYLGNQRSLPLDKGLLARMVGDASPGSEPARLAGPVTLHDTRGAAQRAALTDAEHYELQQIADANAAYHALSSLDVTPSQLVEAKSAMGPKAWAEFSSAKIRSMGRAKSEDPFDVQQFIAAWNVQPEAFKKLIPSEHRKAIDSAVQSGMLELLQARVVGSEIAKWLGDPANARHVATWARTTEKLSKLRSFEHAAILLDEADEKLVAAVRTAMPEDPADPFEQSAARRRGEISPRPESNLPRVVAAVPRAIAGIAAGLHDTATLAGDVGQGKHIWRPSYPGEVDWDGAKQLELDRQYGQRIGNAALNMIGLGAPVAMIGAPGGVVAGIFGGRIRRMTRTDEPLLGQFPTTTAGRIIDETRKSGGYSVNLPTGHRPESGLMVGVHANTDPRNLIVPTTELARPHIIRHAETNRAQLARPDRYFGTWANPDDAMTYLEVLRRFPPDQIRQATKFAERALQKAGYDVGRGEAFPIRNWEEFIHSPEFRQRLIEAEALGRAYLERFPTKNWWDMHGTFIEEVYGPERMRPMAGYIASTATKRPPRENLQTATVYMGRDIRGEPIVQPEWLTPENTMSRNPGKKIGMEASAAANLEKSRRGALEELRMDKVNEEARALSGDPNAVPLDRHWARLSEKPEAGVYANAQEGVIRGRPYGSLKGVVTDFADWMGDTPRNVSSRIWAAIREMVRQNGELYGTKLHGHAVRGESKSYADHFVDLFWEKAQHLGVKSKEEMIRLLNNGDADLLAVVLSTPAIAAMMSGQLPAVPDGPSEQRASPQQ